MIAPAALLLLTLAAPPDPEAYFSTGPFAEAQRLVERNDPRSAVKVLKRLLSERPEAPERAQARYLLGLCLIEIGEHEEAQRLFAELAEAYPALRDDHLFLRGKALYLWGNKLDAARVLAEVDASGPRGLDALRLRARALAEATDFEQLRRWLEDELHRKGQIDPELLYWLGVARHRSGDVYGAYRALREVWREAPSERFAGPALAMVAGLRIGDRPLLGEVERRAVLGLAGPLSAGKAIEGALAQLEKRLAGQAEARRLRAELAYALGKIAAAHGRHGAAVGHFLRALDQAPAEMTELRARAALEAGKSSQRKGDEAKALELYASVASRFAEQPEAEHARFFAGEILLSKRDYAGAAAQMEALLLANPVTPYRPRCLWALGWVQLRSGHDREARFFFASLTRMNLPAALDQASRYWLARTDANLGEIDKARAGYREVIRRHPLTYYAALAEDQLAEVVPESVPVSPTAPARAEPAALPEALREVAEYARLGLRSRAYDALRAFEKAERRPARRLSEPVLTALARLYDTIGRTVEARRIREEYNKEYAHALSDEDLLAAAEPGHPLKFEGEIRKAADEFGVPDSLLFALVRTESNFRTDAVSPMDARGLAQLIPSTAREVAKRIGLGRLPLARLVRDPGTNVRLGAAYLRQLLDHYEGSEPLALAGYNAGPGAVDAWLEGRVRPVEGSEKKERGVGVMPGADELAEEIPVAETRAYVKTVLARARSYARLYPRERPAEAPVTTAVFAGPTSEPASLEAAAPDPEAFEPGVRVFLWSMPEPSHRDVP